jgi:methylase of polypeptide subunit release factors
MTVKFFNKDGIGLTYIGRQIKDLQNTTPGPYELSSGIILEEAGHLDCGGTLGYQELGTLVEKYKTKNKYSRGLEWCAGLGAFGFHMLGLDLAEHMVFNDYYDYAVRSCLKTAEDNKIKEKVTGYITHTISTIPLTEKWDLVVGNPPHSWDTEQFIERLEATDTPKQGVANIVRCVVDDEMKTHLDFFKNIKNYLTPDADLFIVACDINPIQQFADLGNLKIENVIKMESCEFWYLIHYKPK